MAEAGVGLYNYIFCVSLATSGRFDFLISHTEHTVDDIEILHDLIQTSYAKTIGSLVS